MHTTSSSILRGSGLPDFKTDRRPMPAKDTVVRRSHKGSTKNGTHLGRGGGSSRQQTGIGRQSVAQYVHVNAGSIKVKVN